MSTISVAEQVSGLTGYVRNTDVRTVEGEVQGDATQCRRFIEALERSPAGKVSKVRTQEISESAGEKGFEVRY